ncbi:dihydroorotate dehydrogenase [Tanacetum coccineum]
MLPALSVFAISEWTTHRLRFISFLYSLLFTAERMAGNVGLNENEEFVYRISTAGEWSESQTSGCTYGQQLDKDSRYIHLSKLNQVKSTLERFYMNTSDDLFLLQIDCKKLGDGLLYEDVDGSNVFPHFYGPSRSYVPLTLDMVVKAEKIISSNSQFICSMLS